MTHQEAAVASRADLEKHQLSALQDLLTHVGAGRGFYRAKLDASGVLNGVASLRDFCRDAPFTEKHELVADQAANPPYGSNLLQPLDRYTRFHQTSGTTGDPLRWLDTNDSWEYLIGCWERVFSAGGVTSGDRILFPFSFGPFLGFWAAYDAATRIGALTIPAGGLRSPARLRLIRDHRATVLCCTPTYALRLGEVAWDEGLRDGLRSVRAIVVAGEPGGSIAGTRSRIEQLWPGARVQDHHGMTEMGPVTYECPSRRGVLHVMEAGYFPEVLNGGAAAGPGAQGELVLTNLYRRDSPLLRYRTGDVVRRSAAEVCVCGSSELALEDGILGRTDDMVVMRGVNLYPSAVEDVLRSCPGLAEYRVTIRAEGAQPDILLEVEPVSAESERTLPGQVEAAFRNVFGLRASVSPVPPGTLPRFELKARRWIRGTVQNRK